MKKKKLLFVQDSLALAGSERSLVSLLRHLDPEKFSIDLQLMRYGGPLEKELPAHVRLLPPLEYQTFTNQKLLKSLAAIRSVRQARYFLARLRYSLAIRNKELQHSEKAQLFWETAGRVILPSETEYDAAIGFAQGFPTFYVMDKVKAAKKFCWVNANMIFRGSHKDFQESYYRRFDKVVCISPKTREVMLRQLPSLTNTAVVENIVDFEEINRLADAFDVRFKGRQVNLLTVGRLNSNMKGMDIAMEAARALKEKTDRFHWYFVGEGPYRPAMEAFIKENDLKRYVTLLGAVPNPYPYFHEADMYVQTSRNEGFGRTIAEARLLNVPVVTTRFDSVSQQIVHEENGLITDLDPGAVAEGIYRLMTDTGLFRKIRYNLAHAEKGNLDSVKQFEKMMEV